MDTRFALRGQDGYWRPFCESFERPSMTLIFALLRKDHIIFASDRRHTSGDSNGCYVDDDCWKTERIVNGKAMLGFAGRDLVEQVVQPIRQTLIQADNIRKAANSIASAVQAKYKELRESSNADLPTMEFLVAGFERDNRESVATVFDISPPFLIANQTIFDPDPRQKNFVVIGKKCHGALYILHKCAREMTEQKAGIKLACFTLTEVGKYDKSVGGRPQICVIQPNTDVDDRSDKIAEENYGQGKPATKSETSSCFSRVTPVAGSTSQASSC